MNSGFMVYWMTNYGNPACRLFEMTEMSQALKYMDELRSTPGYQFVGMVSQNPQSVGKAGVSDKLPEDYSWTKQHRADGQPDGPKSIMGSRSHGE